jgi:hypothetical protein
MKNISFFKKIKLFDFFKKTIKENSFELEQQFNIRIDKANRLYTVINIPSNIIGESYNLVKSDIDLISEGFLKEYSSKLSKFLNTKGLSELYRVYEIKKIDKYSYLFVIGYSLFKSHIFYRNIYYILVPFLIGINVILFFILKNL